MLGCTRIPALSLLCALVAFAGCNCQRAENIEAKERLTKPQPKEVSSQAAKEKINVDDLTDAEKMRRVCHMDGSEIAARLGSFAYSSDGELSFGRDGQEAALRSAEKTTVTQADSGDFAITVVTGDGSEQKLAYVNEIFFLKNNNGKWRVSRDPSGERNEFRTDAMNVWRSFYDLVSHALIVERTGATTVDGRGAIAYKLRLPDQTAKAVQDGALVDDGAPPLVPVEGTDGGVVDTEGEDAKRERIAKRVSRWAKRAHPAGGSGSIVVDEATGVPLRIEFKGALVVGDGKAPARLEVKLSSTMKDIGKPQAVSAPKDAIDEVVRHKMPVRPRAMFEEAGVVAPIVDAGPG